MHLSQDATCLVCGGRQFQAVLDGAIVNNYSFGMCANCRMVQAFAVDKAVSFDYSDYGDYLLLNEADARRRIDCVGKTMKPIFKKLRKEFNDAVVLDFGSGAGYFCKAAEEYGFKALGVEPSDKLIEFSRKTVKFDTVYKSVEDINVQCDAIFMFDVIEHLAPEKSRDIMISLLDRLPVGGFLIGNTPNFKSANIRLCKDKDPVIAPPSHVCYFSLRSLDAYLTALGLAKVKSYSRGLSSNSFFRKTKCERSFMEKGLRSAKIHELPLLIALRTFFAAAGFLLQPFGLGYQIYFVYQKKSVVVAKTGRNSEPLSVPALLS
jgi:2-polyprenyl-3-methyl-5-hydroxy-6-metoxy-1,4-benzoquinol methylase